MSIERLSALIILLSLCHGHLNAQVLQKGGDSTTDKVEVFVSTSQPIDQNDWKGIIKISPLLVFNGEIPFYYEHKLSRHLSAEAALGFTFRDYIYTYLHSSAEFLSEEYQVKMGMTAKAALKFYPGSDGFPEGIFFSPTFRFKTHNVDFNTEISGADQGIIPLKRNFTDVVLLVGYQEEWDSNFFVEYYFGTGIRNRSIEEAKGEVIPDPVDINKWHFTTTKTSRVVPLLSLGVKLGFGF